MDFLILIKNGCESLTATAAPSVDALGLRMVLALATIMLVWFGVQEALSSAHGGPGFHVGKFVSFFVLMTFAYCFVRFYDGAIPGIGYSLKGFISGGTSSLVDYIGNDSTQEVQNTIHTAVGKIGSLSPSFTEPYTLLCSYTVQVVLSTLSVMGERRAIAQNGMHKDRNALLKLTSTEPTAEMRTHYCYSFRNPECPFH